MSPPQCDELTGIVSSGLGSHSTTRRYGRRRDTFDGNFTTARVRKEHDVGVCVGYLRTISNPDENSMMNDVQISGQLWCWWIFGLCRKVLAKPRHQGQIYLEVADHLNSPLPSLRTSRRFVHFLLIVVKYTKSTQRSVTLAVRGAAIYQKWPGPDVLSLIPSRFMPK